MPPRYLGAQCMCVLHALQDNYRSIIIEYAIIMYNTILVAFKFKINQFDSGPGQIKIQPRETM